MTRHLLLAFALFISPVGAQEWPRLSVGPAGAAVTVSPVGNHLFGRLNGRVEPLPLPPGTQNAVFAETGELVLLRGGELEVVDPVSLQTLRRGAVPRLGNPVQPYSLAAAAGVVVVGGSIPFEVTNPHPSFYVFALETLEPLGSFTASMFSGVSDLELSRDGGTLVGTSGDGTMRFWDVRTGRETGTTYLAAHGYGVALSPDDRFVAAPFSRPANGGVSVRVWEFASGVRVADLTGLADVTDIEIVRRGDKTLVAATGGQRYRVWSLPGGETLLAGEVSGPAAVAFRRDRLLLAVGDALITLTLP